MTRYILKISGLLFLIVFIFNSCFKDDLLKEIDALKSQVSTMQRRNDSLNNLLNVRADSLGKALSNAQKRSDSLANVLRTKSDSLSLALGLTNANLANLTKSVDSIKTQIATISGQLTQLNLQLTSITTQLTQLNQQLGALGGDVSQFAAQYQTLSASLQTINTQIAALQGEQLNLLEKLNAILLQLNPPVEITTGLVAFYQFNGNTGDSSGNGNHGFLNGVVQATGKNGRPNTAYSFNGISNTIELPNAFFNGAQINEFTFTTRVNVASTSNSPNIWGKTFFWGEVNFQINSDNSVQLWWANSFSGNKYSTIKSNPNTIQPNSWTDIAVVFKNSIGTIYINGINVQTNLSWSAQGGALLSTTQIESVCNFAQIQNSSKIGARFVSGVLTSFLSGSIDDFRIYNRTLTQNEISFLASN